MFIDAIPWQGSLISSTGGVLPDEGDPNLRNTVDSLLGDVHAFHYIYAWSLCCFKYVYRS
jgi:hypothetical protein